MIPIAYRKGTAINEPDGLFVPEERDRRDGAVIRVVVYALLGIRVPALGPARLPEDGAEVVGVGCGEEGDEGEGDTEVEEGG